MCLWQALLAADKATCVGNGRTCVFLEAASSTKPIKEDKEIAWSLSSLDNEVSDSDGGNGSTLRI